MEAELDTCKAKLRAVEAQLLEVLEEKLRLKQEVEAWEVGWECRPGLGGGQGQTGRGLAPEPALLPPGGHAAAGEAAGGESAAERVQGRPGRGSGSPSELWNCQDPLGPTPLGSTGTLAVRELSPRPWEEYVYSLKFEV